MKLSKGDRVVVLEHPDFKNKTIVGKSGTVGGSNMQGESDVYAVLDGEDNSPGRYFGINEYTVQNYLELEQVYNSPLYQALK